MHHNCIKWTPLWTSLVLQANDACTHEQFFTYPRTTFQRNKSHSCFGIAVWVILPRVRHTHKHFFLIVLFYFWLHYVVRNFSCAPDGVQTSGLWISSPTLWIYQLSHPVTSYLVTRKITYQTSALLYNNLFAKSNYQQVCLNWLCCDKQNELWMSCC